MPARLAALLDGNDGSLSMTLGLGDPVGSSSGLANASYILGRQIKEASLYVKAGTISPTAPVLGLPNAPLPGDSGGSGDGGGGDGGGDGGVGGDGSGNSGGDNGAGAAGDA